MLPSESNMTKFQIRDWREPDSVLESGSVLDSLYGESRMHLAHAAKVMQRTEGAKLAAQLDAQRVLAESEYATGDMEP
jgi:hypothetical protein